MEDDYQAVTSMHACPLKLSRKDFERLGDRAIRLAAEHIAGIRERPVHRRVPVHKKRLLMDGELPHAGLTADEIISFIDQNMLPYPLPNGHPMSFAWFLPPPAPIAVLAETLATTINASGDGFEHAGTYLLPSVTRWLMQLCGFPVEASMGLLLSGGSMANLTALTAARHRAARDAGWNVREQGLQGDTPPLTLYTSDQSHSSVRKAAELLGLGASAVRALASDQSFRLDIGALRDAINSDRRAGCLPFCVTAAAGSTNTGAIDPLNDVADVCAEENLWMHVDGAYGALGRLDPDFESCYTGVERADSLSMDPHKWLMTPLDCGALFVRDRALLKEAHSVVPPYLQEGDEAAPWQYEYMFPLTYGNRVIKTWATLVALGQTGVRELVQRCNALARKLGSLIESAPELELAAPVSLSVVCFRYVPRDAARDKAELNALNTALAESICSSGEAYVPTTVLRGQTVLRAAIMHYDNVTGDVERLIDVVRKAGRKLARDRARK